MMCMNYVTKLFRQYEVINLQRGPTTRANNGDLWNLNNFDVTLRINFESKFKRL